MQAEEKARPNLAKPCRDLMCCAGQLPGPVSRPDTQDLLTVLFPQTSAIWERSPLGRAVLTLKDALPSQQKQPELTLTLMTPAFSGSPTNNHG